MQIDPTIATLIGTAIGAFAGIGGTVLATLIIQRGETTRHTRKLLIDTAMQNWLQLEKTADAIGKDTGIRPASPPLDVYIVHAAKLLEVCDLKHIDPEAVTKLIKDLSAVTDAAVAAIKSKAKNDDARTAKA